MAFEDLDIILTIISKCNRISYVPKPFNNYFRRQNSISTSFDSMIYLDKMIAYRDAINNVDPKYYKCVSYWIANNIYDCIYREELKYFKAEFVEILQEFLENFSNNEFVQKDVRLKNVFNFRQLKTIPKKIFIDDSECKNRNRDIDGSLKYYGKEYEFEYIFNTDNQENYNLQSYRIHNDESEFISRMEEYTKLKKLYKSGGILLDSKIRIKKPLGQFRVNQGFLFLSKEGDKILTSVYGFEKKSDFLYDVISSYENDNLDIKISLKDRFRITMKKYKWKNSISHKTGKETINLYNNAIYQECFEEK